MDDIYDRMNDTLLMAHAQRRADESYGKLAQLKADIAAAEQAHQWIISLCWWLHRVSAQDWGCAAINAGALERWRTASIYAA